MKKFDEHMSIVNNKIFLVTSIIALINAKY